MVICSVGRKNIIIAGSIWKAISKWAIWRGNSAFRARSRYAPVKFGIVSGAGCGYVKFPCVPYRKKEWLPTLSVVSRVL